MRRPLLAAAIALAAACSRDRSQPACPGLQTGEAHLAVPGGTIWYKVSGTGKGTPLVLLHGGPGLSSYGYKPLEDLGDDRPVIRYDQLGSGKSDRITDTTMFNIGHFVRELDSLRSHLGCTRWHVYGHSWGSILALEYYRAHPNRVVSLTLGSAVLDVPALQRLARVLLKKLPDSSQRAVQRAEQTRTYDTPGYRTASQQFWALYVTHHPVQADLDSMLASANAGMNSYMLGPSAFTITGTLKTYDATDFLPQVAVPTLLTVGEFDQAGPELVRRFAARIPHAQYALIAGSGHATAWDAREVSVSLERAFLRSVDSAPVAPRH